MLVQNSRWPADWLDSLHWNFWWWSVTNLATQDQWDKSSLPTTNLFYVLDQIDGANSRDMFLSLRGEYTMRSFRFHTRSNPGSSLTLATIPSGLYGLHIVILLMFNRNSDTNWDVKSLVYISRLSDQCHDKNTRVSNQAIIVSDAGLLSV